MGNSRSAGLIVLVAVLMIGHALCAGAGEAQPVQLKASAPKNKPPSSFTGVAQSLQKRGVRTCLGRVDQVVGFLMAGGQSYIGTTMVPAGEPDRQLVTASIGMQLKNGNAAYIGASFSPNQTGSCSAVYEAVVYWPQQCHEVAKKSFGSFKKIDGLPASFEILDGGALVRVLLLNAGQGCVSIKKEIIR